jgi:hypothetical protein
MLRPLAFQGQNKRGEYHDVAKFPSEVKPHDFGIMCLKNATYPAVNLEQSTKVCAVPILFLLTVTMLAVRASAAVVSTPAELDMPICEAAQKTS